jgi:hypothetical protein
LAEGFFFKQVRIWKLLNSSPASSPCWLRPGTQQCPSLSLLLGTHNSSSIAATHRSQREICSPLANLSKHPCYRWSSAESRLCGRMVCKKIPEEGPGWTSWEKREYVWAEGEVGTWCHQKVSVDPTGNSEPGMALQDWPSWASTRPLHLIPSVVIGWVLSPRRDIAFLGKEAVFRQAVSQ